MSEQSIDPGIDDIERARQLLQSAHQDDAGESDFAAKLQSIDEMIRVARRLNHPRLPNDATRSDEATRTLIGEARDRSRTLLQAAAAMASNLSLGILRGTERTPDEVLRLAKLLDRLNEFAMARRILDKARSHPDFGKDKKMSTQINQRRALYTYKDVTLPLGTRLTDAFDFLEKQTDLAETTDQETLGLAGAICKRMWDLERNERHLRRALSYYHRGYEQKPWQDQGYTSINAAYVLDLLAFVIGGSDPEADSLRQRAKAIRREIVDLVPPMTESAGGRWLLNEWFYYSTVGEAYFGLGEFEKAIDWLVARPTNAVVSPPDWEFETSARQIANLVRIQNTPGDFTGTEAWRRFEEFLRTSSLGKGGDVSSEAVQRLSEGKIGLALSGGGFRASLFQIGVLARLAELDVLRRIEVISCVSGGSIVGAHYYLEVRKLLQEKPDAHITRGDYIDIVHRLEENFLAGVQTNIRMSVFIDPQIVRRMLRRDYSRTTRLGELYEERLYSAVADEARGDDGKTRERYMHELVVHPRRENGQPWEDFKPQDHNWRRDAKVPVLILNAATLNTGHNWQFTATFMGEAPATIHREIDSIYRLRRKYYTEGPDGPKTPQKVRLGAAVAASSCVPGLFEPLELENAYETRDGGRLDVKLVDGGVCDNQGVAGLLEQDCTVLLVSDGSGQIDAVASPASAALGVLLRSNSILQARVRGTQYRDLDSRRHGSMLAGLMFVHLKKDLDNTPVDWTDCPPESRVEAPDDRLVKTRYGVPKEVQRRLAAIRTDLDSFCDQEADALMLSGYRMTEYEYRIVFGSPGGTPPKTERWRFHRVESRIDSTSPPGDFTAVLDAAGGLFFKIWKLDPELSRRAARLKKLAAAALVGGVVAILAALARVLWLATVRGSAGATSLLTVLGAALALAVLGVPFLGLVAWLRFRRQAVPLPHFAMGVALLLLASPAARYHMRNYERKYLDRGRL